MTIHSFSQREILVIVSAIRTRPWYCCVCVCIWDCSVPAQWLRVTGTAGSSQDLLPRRIPRYRHHRDISLVFSEFNFSLKIFCLCGFIIHLINLVVDSTQGDRDCWCFFAFALCHVECSVPSLNLSTWPLWLYVDREGSAMQDYKMLLVKNWTNLTNWLIQLSEWF